MGITSETMGGCSSGEQEMNEAEQQAAAKRQKASFAASSQEEERATAMNTDLARIEKEQAAALSEAKAELSRDYEPTRDMVSIYFSQLNITVPFVSTEEIEDSEILVEKELDLVVRTATGVWTLEAGVWEGSSQHKSTAMLSSLDTPTKSGWFVDQA